MDVHPLKLLGHILMAGDAEVLHLLDEDPLLPGAMGPVTTGTSPFLSRGMAMGPREVLPIVAIKTELPLSFHQEGLFGRRMRVMAGGTTFSGRLMELGKVEPSGYPLVAGGTELPLPFPDDPLVLAGVRPMAGKAVFLPGGFMDVLRPERRFPPLMAGEAELLPACLQTEGAFLSWGKMAFSAIPLPHGRMNLCPEHSPMGGAVGVMAGQTGAAPHRIAPVLPPEVLSMTDET